MENERTKLKKNNKKNDTLGNVNKPPCDFTADINILSHQTAFMKAAQKRMNFKESLSLEHMRMKDKIMNEGTKLITRDDLQDDMQNQSLMTHQAMQREMLENEKKNDMQIQFDSILTGHETLSKETMSLLSKDKDPDLNFGKKKSTTPQSQKRKT